MGLRKRKAIRMESYKSEIAKVLEKGFRKSKPLDQIEAISTYNKLFPVKKEYRESPSDTKRIPIEQEMRNKEYEELIKQKNKLLKEKTA